MKRHLFLIFLVLLPGFAMAGEGGTSHVQPGAMATFSDLPGTSPAWFVKPMYLHYSGKAYSGNAADKFVDAKLFGFAPLGGTYEAPKQ